MDLHTAYHIMGLPEDCSLEDLEEKYYLLTETKITLDQLEDIQTAYNVIKSHILEINPPPKDPFRVRVKEFFYHYKAHLFFGIIGAFIIGLFGYSFITGQIEKVREANKPPADLNMMLFGAYPDEELTPLEDRILEKLPHWEEVNIEVVYSPTGFESQFDVASIQKSRIELATSEPDLYIFDLHHLELFMEEGIFFPLDQFENELHTEDRWHLFKLEDDKEEHIYGLDISDLDLFSDLEIEPYEKIAVIRTNPKNEEKTLEFLQTILQE